MLCIPHLRSKRRKLKESQKFKFLGQNVVALLISYTQHITSDVPESFLSSQSHKPFQSESSKIFFEASHDLVESQKLSSQFESLVCKLESMSNQMKFHIFSMTFLSYEMAPGKLENGDQYCFSKFGGRLFISKFFQLHCTCLFHYYLFQQV